MAGSLGPDFVGVGCQKCGSTWLSYVLEQHPGVLIRQKETGFYTRYFHKGYRWYHAFFADKNGRIAGEITPDYFISPRPDPSHKEFYPKWNPRLSFIFWHPRRPPARDELFRHYPDVRVFAIFRNPIDRAWSHYWFWREKKKRLNKRVVPFEEMFRDDGRWILTQGKYTDYLASWRECFPDMGVFFFDDLLSDPLGLAQSLYRFVGVDDTFVPSLTENMMKGTYKPMPREVWALLVDAYRDEIVRFANATGRDLSHWLEARD